MSEMDRLCGVLRANWQTKPEIRVRAILQALREPSEATVEAASTICDDPAEALRAMLDHILNEPKERVA